MDFEEYAGKRLVAARGLTVPEGRLCRSAEEARGAALEVGACVVKAQVAAGKRGKAGGVRRADTPDEAFGAASDILGMFIGGLPVRSVLVEARQDIRQELYAAVVSDAASKGPLLLFSCEGGMDIEEVAARSPERVRRLAVDVLDGFGVQAARGLIEGMDVQAPEAVAGFLAQLYEAWRALDAELLEINPLAVLGDGSVCALDCKLSVDDASVFRQAEAAGLGAVRQRTELERRAAELKLNFIELDGNIGVLANGAGLTMTTVDLVAHFGGRPANFLEIGGEAYTKSKAALELLLSKPGLKCLVVNFCGAFARADVMTRGVVEAWEALRPELPVFFSIHGPGEEEGRALVRERLGAPLFGGGEEAVQAAVEAAR